VLYIPDIPGLTTAWIAGKEQCAGQSDCCGYWRRLVTNRGGVTGPPSGAARQARHANRPRRAPLHGAPGCLTGPALRLLIGVSVYREPAGRNALLFQIGQAGPATASWLAVQGPAPPYHAPADLAELISECEDAGLLVVPRIPRGPAPVRAEAPPVFVDRRIAGALHRDLTAAGRGGEVTRAHQCAAEYWQWRAAAWPQDRHADLHDLLEGRHHLHEAGNNDQAGALTEVVCAQLHAWGELDHEAALIRETLDWLPPRSPLRAAWIQEIGKIAQVQGNYAEAERHYQQSMEMSASNGDAAAVSRSLHRLGILAQARGDYAEAERRYQLSLDLIGQPAYTAAEDAAWPSDPEPDPQDAQPPEPDPQDAQPPEPDPQDAQPPEPDPQDAQPPDVRPRRARRAGSTSGQRNGQRGRRCHDHRRGRRNNRPNELLCLVGTAFAAAVVLIALSAAGFTRFLPHGGQPSSPIPAAVSSTSAAAVRHQAAAWIARQLSRGAIVSCDPAMCAALRRESFPAGNLLMLGPSAEDPLGSDVVVATAAVRSQFGSRLDGVYAPEVAAAFGAGNAQIQVRVVAPDGAAAYRNALRADLLARQAAGTELLRNKDIRVTAAARKQLTAGQVDSRLLITLAALAAQHALRIVAFADSGPGTSPGMPLRMAEISAPGAAGRPAAGGPTAGRPALVRPGHTRFLRSVLAFLRAQRPPYLAASVRTARNGNGQDAAQVEFAGPSPLGLLTAGDAGADANP
jgi:tetratricopeptide (TPR) repeat protein